MAVTSKRTLTVEYYEDLIASFSFETVKNLDSPGSIGIYALTTGANTITLPADGVVKGCIVVPPEDNAETITLKGVSGDTGIAMNPSEPFSLSFDTDTPPTSFVLTVGGDITGLRILWT